MHYLRQDLSTQYHVYMKLAIKNYSLVKRDIAYSESKACINTYKRCEVYTHTENRALFSVCVYTSQINLYSKYKQTQDFESNLKYL